MKESVKRIRTIVKNVQYLSDIHLEYRKAFVDVPILSKNLVLAGDIGNPFKDNYKEFLIKCSNEYENTFVIPGNHEYWGSNMDKTDDKMNEMIRKFNNVHSLKNAIIETENITFVGCTLWSRILKEPVHRKGDEHNIKINNKNVNWHDLNRVHSYDLHWLTNMLQNHTIRPIVVVTHHIPTYKLLHPKYNVDQYKDNLDRYYTDLEHLIKPPIVAWICGHSHCTMNMELNGVHLYLNAIGYPNEKEATYLRDKAKVINFKFLSA